MIDCNYVATGPNKISLECVKGMLTNMGWSEYIIILLIGLFIFIAFCMWVMPIYNVWSSRKAGEADLAQSQYEQKIQIAEAQGRFDAAELNKKAAIVEAEAVAAQIKEIGEGLTNHNLYLRWQWIKMMEDTANKRSTIYVPTEANLPILEAGRLNQRN